MKLLAPESVPFETQRPDVRVVSYDPAVPIPPEHTDAEVLVVWGMPERLLRDAATRLPHLRLVQLLSAGSDAASAAGFSADTTLCSGRGLHDAPVAEHALALILAAARRLPTAIRAQIGHRWAEELGGIQAEPSPGVFSTLRQARIVIWGYGSIGSSLAPHLQMLGATVTGVATSARADGSVRVVTTESLPQILPHTDVLLMILPASPDTEGALSAHLISALPRHAWVVNVGRGTTLDEQALISALRSNSLGGAALDVVQTEPLPPGSDLWDLPNIILTPHAAGGRPLGAAALIEANLNALLDGRVLRNRVTH